jgi:hypothetical protein
LKPASETPDIASLLVETRAALAHLRADELEALALRAEEMLHACSIFNPRAADILREHCLLGNLLSATGENLRVLQCTHGSVEGSTRWAR